MSPRRLLIGLFASWLLLPVSCTVVMVPVTRLLVASSGQDLQAGEKPTLPLYVAMVDSAAPGEAELVPLSEMAARRAQAPTLSAWLPDPNGEIGEGENRVFWRPVPSSGAAREMEVVKVGDTHSHTFRYAVSKDGAVRPLRSTVSDMSHMFMAMGLGIVVALLLRRLAVRARRRLEPTPAPG